MAKRTPEGKVKEKVRAVLNDFKAYYFMPVQQGFGRAGLDFHCHIKTENQTEAFYIETKAPGGKPTERQQILINRLRDDGAKVFIIDGDEGCAKLKLWLLTKTIHSVLSPTSD